MPELRHELVESLREVVKEHIRANIPSAAKGDASQRYRDASGDTEMVELGREKAGREL